MRYMHMHAMYSNQRQKKRSSQFRKKYHDSRSKGKEGETSKQPQKQQNKPPQPVKDEARRTDETSCQGIVRNAGEVYVGHLTESASRSQC